MRIGDNGGAQRSHQAGVFGYQGFYTELLVDGLYQADIERAAADDREVFFKGYAARHAAYLVGDRAVYAGQDILGTVTLRDARDNLGLEEHGAGGGEAGRFSGPEGKRTYLIDAYLQDAGYYLQQPGAAGGADLGNVEVDDPPVFVHGDDLAALASYIYEGVRAGESEIYAARIADYHTVIAIGAGVAPADAGGSAERDIGRLKAGLLERPGPDRRGGGGVVGAGGYDGRAPDFILAVYDNRLAGGRTDIYAQEIPAHRPFPFNIISIRVDDSCL